MKFQNILLDPDGGLLLWQVIVFAQLIGSVYTIVRLYQHQLDFKTKTVGCFLVLCVPLGWIIYLLLRKQSLRRGAESR